MEDFEIELKLEFLSESEDLLDAAETAFLKLESERDNLSLLNEIFRLAHNLKGTSKAVGFDQLAEITHVAENLILKLKDGIIEVDDTTVTLLLDFKDKVQEIVSELKNDLNYIAEIEEFKSRINSKLENISNESVEIENIDESEDLFSDDLSSNDLEVLNNENDNEVEPDLVQPEISTAALESLAELGITNIESNSNNPTENQETKPEVKTNEMSQKVEKSSAASKKTKSSNSESDESIRVNLSRIDKMNNIVGELVILQTITYQRRYEFIQDDLTNKTIGMMGKLFKEIQELAMSLRMLPLKNTFQKMNRIVRDTSKLLDKKVKLELVGEDTEVDKTVLEKISDPLVHIIRNAVDHGLESTEDRKIVGKDEVGIVELFAYHEGSNLVIQVTDDGKGIDPEVIKKKAIEKGVITSNSKMSDQDILQLIFHPGFSTKEHVTEVSGRGVGMDVVKTNIEELGGEVSLMSKMGTGSSFKIVLPLTLAIIEGLIINSGDNKYAVPLSQIFEIVQVRAKDINDFTGIAKLFRLRGEVLPIFNLNDKLGNPCLERDSYTVIIVRGIAYNFGVIVDDILNQQQIVIKKLGEDIKDQRGLMGSAIMADGKPSLILDLFEVFKNDLKPSRNYKKLLEEVA